MSEEQKKNMLKSTFDTVAEGYDNTALRFFPETARHLAALLPLAGDEQVLDVATGTGHAAFALASRLPRGRVTAVDFSPGMLAQARRKAASLGVLNIEFLERDMQDLCLRPGSFDAASCSFGIFFVEDMAGQLSHIATMVRPGGRVAITGFQEDLFHPLSDLFFERMDRYGVPKPPLTWKRIATERGCRQLFGQAGLTDIRVEKENVGYYLDDAEEWWGVVWNAGLRGMVNQLDPASRERFKQEHLAEVAALATAKGIWLDVGVLFTSGMTV